MRVFVAVIVTACLLALPAHAHGGGLDKYGCHRDSRAGTRHCHGTTGGSTGGGTGGGSTGGSVGGSTDDGFGVGTVLVGIGVVVLAIVTGVFLCSRSRTRFTDSDPCRGDTPCNRWGRCVTISGKCAVGSQAHCDRATAYDRAGVRYVYDPASGSCLPVPTAP